MAGTKNMRSRCSEETLNGVLEVLESMVSSVKDMIETDKSMQEICTSHGIDWVQFRRQLVLNIDKYQLGDLKPVDQIECPYEEPYIYLYRTLLNIGKDEIRSYDIPYDAEDTIIYVLENPEEFHLLEREALVLKYSFGFMDNCFYTQQEIGEMLGVTISRVHQIQAKALRRLKFPSTFKMIKCGMVAYHEEQEVAEKAAQLLDEQRNSRIDELANKIVSEHHDDITDSDVMASLGDMDIYQLMDYMKSYDLNNLGLSVRTFNCCKRSGNSTLFDICTVPEDEIIKIRNMGVRSKEELISKINEILSRHGYTLNQFQKEYFEIDEEMEESIDQDKYLDLINKASSPATVRYYAEKMYMILSDSVKNNERMIEMLKRDLSEKDRYCQEIKASHIRSVENLRTDFESRLNSSDDNEFVIQLTPPYKIYDDETQGKLIIALKGMIEYIYQGIIQGKYTFQDSVMANAYNQIRLKYTEFDYEYIQFKNLINGYNMQIKYFTKFN